VKRFLDSFGRGNRKTTPSEAMPSVVQAALLLNSELVKSKVLASTKESLVGTLLGRTPDLSNEQLVEELFLATLSRFPTAEEMKKSTGFLERYRDKGAEDLQWTLLNKLEFVVNY
jgi:dsRNA-specific ribonuclease